MKISIPEPCHEDWNAMTSVDAQQRHCAACDRTLTDFTAMTDAEIGRHLRRNAGKICGRLSAQQLNRKLALSGPRHYGGTRAVAAAAGLLLTVPVVGQGAPPLQTELSPRVNNQPGNDPISSKSKASALSEAITITGVVTDEDGEGLIGASVLIMGTTTGTVTDLDGRFLLKVSTLKPVSLQISYTGFETMEIEITKAAMQELDASTLELEVAPMMFGAVELQGYFIVRRSLAHRIFVAPINRFVVWPVKKAVRDIGVWQEGRFDRREARQLQRDERRALRAENAIEDQTKLINQEKIAAPSTTVAPPKLSFTASPNPFNDHLRINFSMKERGNYRLELYSASGKLVKSWDGVSEAGPQERVLDQELGSLPAGMYFLELTTKEAASVLTLVR